MFFTIFNYIFTYGWLIGVLVALFLILRSLEKRSGFMVTLTDIAMKDAESTRKAVEAVREMIDLLKEKQK